MATLQSMYEISKGYLEIEEELLHNEGELTPELEAKLEITQEALAEKSQNYIYVIKKQEMLKDAIKLEITRLKAMEKACDNVSKRLTNSIDNAMRMFNLNELILPLHKITYRKSESINISVDPEELPKDCQIIKQEIKAISKTELKKRIKAGEEIPGVELQINKILKIK